MRTAGAPVVDRIQDMLQRFLPGITRRLRPRYSVRGPRRRTYSSTFDPHPRGNWPGQLSLAQPHCTVSYLLMQANLHHHLRKSKGSLTLRTVSTAKASCAAANLSGFKSSLETSRREIAKARIITSRDQTEASMHYFELIEAGIEPDCMTYNALIANCDPDERITRNQSEDGGDDDVYHEELSSCGASRQKNISRFQQGSSTRPYFETKLGGSDVQLPKGTPNTSETSVAAMLSSSPEASPPVCKAADWYWEMCARGVQPDKNTFLILINMCAKFGKPGDIEYAEIYFNILLDESAGELDGVKPDVDVFNAILGALARAEPLPRGDNAAISTSDPSVTSSELFIMSTLERADGYLALMESMAIPPTCETFNAMLLVCANSQPPSDVSINSTNTSDLDASHYEVEDVRLVRAEEYWDTMKALGIQCNEITLSALIKLCKTMKTSPIFSGSEEGTSVNAADAERLRAERDARVAKALLLAEECSETLESRLGKMGTNSTKNSVAGVSTKKAKSTANVDSINSERIQPSSVSPVYMDLLSTLDKELAIQKMSNPDIGAFNEAITACLDKVLHAEFSNDRSALRKVDMLICIEQLFLEMRRRGVHPSHETFSSLVMASICESERKGSQDIASRAHEYAEAYRNVKTKEGKSDDDTLLEQLRWVTLARRLHRYR